MTLLGGTALSFDGTNDFVQLSNTTTGNFGTGNFTVEMWINTTDSYGGLAGKLSGCGTNWDLFLGSGKLESSISRWVSRWKYRSVNNGIGLTYSYDAIRQYTYLIRRWND